VKIDALPPRSPDGGIFVFVEIPKGSHNKYEFDEELGVFRLDRALYSAVYYPTEYGFVPGTLGEDDEALDALVMVDEPSFPGCLVEARLIGAMVVESASGRREHKLLAVPVDDPRFAEYGDVSEVPEHRLHEIEHFFEVFKDLEERPVSGRGWIGAQHAERVLRHAIERHERDGGS
jgi:inorganic pyrophosphatase